MKFPCICDSVYSQCLGESLHSFLFAVCCWNLLSGVVCVTVAAAKQICNNLHDVIDAGIDGGS
jgi:hypothetical protein